MEAPERPEDTALQKFGFRCTLVYVFFRFSFLHEFITAKTGLDTHLSLVLYSLCYIACALSGRALIAWKRKVTLVWVLFAACMCLATVTSFWRGGSFTVTSDYLRTALPLLFVFPALIVTPNHIKKILNTIGIAGIATVILGVFTDSFRGGRLALDALGTIGNSNDYAAHLIFVLPAIAYLTLGQRRNLLIKACGVFAIGIGLFNILSTGSRGGLVGLIVTAVYLFLASSPKIKLLILVGAPITVLSAIPFLPGEAATRLASLFSSSAQTEEAADSREDRLALLRESVKATFEHPVLGVGPGVFMEYQGNDAENNGQRGLWHVTHNSYTQVSSECGIPAFFLYLAGLGLTFCSLRRSGKSSNPEVAVPARVLTIAMLSLCTCMIFLSNAYTVNLLVLTGLAISLSQIQLCCRGLDDIRMLKLPRPIRVLSMLEAYSITGPAKAVLEFARESACAPTATARGFVPSNVC